MSALVTDPEILAFIDEVDQLTPPGTVDRTVDEQRALYDTMSDHFRAPRPPGIDVIDGRIAGVPCRTYGAAAIPNVIFLHGGGFVVGGLDSHDDVAAEIAAQCACRVTAVDYRLAPEHLHPAAYADALAVTLAMDAPVTLVGDSAGGTLAASVAWTLRGTGKIAGQVLIYPSLGGYGLGLASYSDCAEAPLLTTADIVAYSALRSGGANLSQDPTHHVLAAGNLAGTAPAFISAAGADPMRDDGVEFARRLGIAGITASCLIEDQLPHMWLRARHRSRRASDAFGRVLSAITGFASGVSVR